MMVAAGGDECRLLAKSLRQFETEHAAIERQRPIEIGNLQMNVPNANARIDGCGNRPVFQGNFCLYGHHPCSKPIFFVRCGWLRLPARC